MYGYLDAPHKQRNQLEQEELINAATALCEKLGNLHWKDRDICFSEWDRLTKCLSTFNV